MVLSASTTVLADSTIRLTTIPTTPSVRRTASVRATASIRSRRLCSASPVPGVVRGSFIVKFFSYKSLDAGAAALSRSTAGAAALSRSTARSMPKLTLVARLTDGLPLAASMEEEKDHRELDAYKASERLPHRCWPWARPLSSGRLSPAGADQTVDHPHLKRPSVASPTARRPRPRRSSSS